MSENVPTYYPPSRDFYGPPTPRAPHVEHQDDFTSLMPAPVRHDPTDPANIPPVMSEREFLGTDTEAMVRREAHNSVVQLDAMEHVATLAAAFVDRAIAPIPRNRRTDDERDLFDAVQTWRGGQL